ncbi:hypothetical protein OAB07_00860 [Candidatus Pelagibacter sp.]|nr:hypothetical protein [Candidatus Pelagibacter sp.]
MVDFEFNIFDYCTVNILFFSNTLLLLAILKINISTIILIVCSLFILNTLLFYKFIKKKIFQPDNLIFLIFFGLILFILSVNIANNLTLGWDAQTIWFPRAINFYNELNFTEVSQYARMPEYPFFGSLSWAFFWKLFYFDKEYYGRIFYLLIFLVSIFNFSDLLKTSMIKKIFFSLILILLTYDYWHFRGFQEILIFSFLLIISKYLYYIICENKIELKYLFIILIASNLIIWTKNEGVVFSFFIYLLLTIFSKFSFKIKFINFIFFISIVFIRFFIFETNNLTVGLQNTFDFKNIFSIFFENLTIFNLKTILINLILTIFKFPIIFVSLLISLMIIFSKIDFKKILFVYFYFLLNIGFIFVTYLSTTFDINFMVVTGLNRVFFESSALYLLFGLFYLKNKFKI